MTPPLRRELFRQIFRLYLRQPWVVSRDPELLELLSLCKKSEHEDLIIELLRNFHFLKDATVDRYLALIADFITNEAAFGECTTQITALTYDGSADSSQAILHWIKLPLYKSGWTAAETVNSFGRSIKTAARGRTQIIFIDEFVGSGKTVITRMEWFEKNIKVKCDVKFCFIAGMASGIKKIENLGFDVFCPLVLDKGISDMSISNGRFEKIEYMKELEDKLAPVIANHNLSDYSFGYGRAEALYSLESRSMNTPNSVFPIFWWPRLKEEHARNTLLTRVEKGLS